MDSQGFEGPGVQGFPRRSEALGAWLARTSGTVATEPRWSKRTLPNPQLQLTDRERTLLRRDRSNQQATSRASAARTRTQSGSVGGRVRGRAKGAFAIKQPGLFFLEIPGRIMRGTTQASRRMLVKTRMLAKSNPQSMTSQSP